MTRSIITMIVTMFTCVSPLAHARPLRPTRSSQAALADATQLDRKVKRLLDEGKSHDALRPAERSLALRETTLGAMDPDIATSLNNLAEVYSAEGMPGKAESLLVRALAIREKTFGPMHLDVALTLNDLGDTYRVQGAYDKAEPLLMRALDIREKMSGSESPEVATSLDELAGLYYTQGDYRKAEPLYTRALNIREKVLGPMHRDVATSLNDLGLLYKHQGAYDKAESLYARALSIREKVLGAMHRDVAESLDNLASLYRAQAAYRKAEPLRLRALDIREKTLGPIHPDVGQSLNSLGVLYWEEGAYAKAEPLLKRALDINEKALGPMHPEVATNLDNLASLYKDKGTYEKAEPLRLRALEIREKTLGATHPDVALSLSNLATIYQDQGAYDKAEPLYARAVKIFENALGATHPDVAKCLNNLAGVYKDQGAYDKAEPLYARALEIHEKVLGAAHPHVAVSLNNLASLYQLQGAMAKAEPLLVRALDIDEKALGPAHPMVAKILNNLASSYRARGADVEAEPVLLRALNIYEKALGEMHPNVAVLLNNLASLYLAQGAYAKAERLVSRATDIQEDQLRHELARLSTSRKHAFMQLVQTDTESVISMQADAMPASAEALELALTTVLRRKGRVLDSLASNHARLLARLEPTLRDKYQQFTEANTGLSMLLRAPFDPRNAANRAIEITDLRAHIDDLEAALNAASAEFRVKSEVVTVTKVKAALPRGAALVEFVSYRRVDPRRPHAGQERRYVAYVLPWRGPARWVSLGEAAPIDTGINAVLAAMHGNTSVDAARTALRHLDALVFAPVRGQLTDVTHLILAPDGKLNLVPFEALIDAQGRYAMENWLVSYVGSGRDLLQVAAQRPPRSPAMIVAAPDYGPPRSAACEGQGSFCPLAGALAEAAELPAYLPNARVATGKQATKAVLAAAVGPSVLHIATHGFFMRDEAPSSPPATAVPAPFPTRGLYVGEPEFSSFATRGLYVKGAGFSSFAAPSPGFDDPMKALDQAGLAMARANTDPDGIVTARELAGYDWWGTQLVVLSACETGVGAVPSGEGVYGMRRALVLAGAEAHVVSLWNVDDSSTQQLMRDFYKELARGTGRFEALRQAKLRLLRQPKFVHPYYWAAFIPVGDWTPLEAHVIKRPAGAGAP